MPLRIIIAGAGLAGLTAAVALAKKGHQITIYERRDDDDAGISQSGIQLQPNALRLLKQLDMLDAIDQISDSNRWSDLRHYASGEVLEMTDMDRRGGVRYASRRALKGAFASEAIRHGTVYHKGVGIEQAYESGTRAFVELSDGTTAVADLVIGADGAYSRVRQSLYPSYQPKVLPVVIYQVQVPRHWMHEHEATRILDERNPAFSVWPGPGCMATSASLNHQDIFDLQLGVGNMPVEDDPTPEIRNGWVKSASYVKDRMPNHYRGLHMIIDKAEKAFKWRLVEVHGLPSWSSKGGRIVLIGDSCHAMVPYAGQGSAMGVEDACVLAGLLDFSEPGDDLTDNLALFEKVRRKRCEDARQYASMIWRAWTTKSEHLIERVRKGIKLANDQAYETVIANSKAPYPTPAFEKWLDEYDATLEVKKALDNPSPLQSRL
jgi:salicylate hydroxylase